MYNKKYYMAVITGRYISHHGIKGQKWGRRRFQNEDGSLTPEGEKRYNDSENTRKTNKAAYENSVRKYKELKNGKAKLRDRFKARREVMARENAIISNVHEQMRVHPETKKHLNSMLEIADEQEKYESAMKGLEDRINEERNKENPNPTRIASLKVLQDNYKKTNIKNSRSFEKNKKEFKEKYGGVSFSW